MADAVEGAAQPAAHEVPALPQPAGEQLASAAAASAAAAAAGAADAEAAVEALSAGVAAAQVTDPEAAKEAAAHVRELPVSPQSLLVHLFISESRSRLPRRATPKAAAIWPLSRTDTHFGRLQQLKAILLCRTTGHLRHALAGRTHVEKLEESGDGAQITVQAAGYEHMLSPQKWEEMSL